MPVNYALLHLDKQQRINTAIDTATKSKVLAISGEKGIGKKTTVNIALNDRDRVVKISAAYNSQYLCQPLVKAFKIDEEAYIDQRDIAFPDYVRRQIFKFCSEKKTILYFEDINLYVPQFVDFVIEIMKSLILNNSEFCTIILLEYDDNENERNILHNKIYSIPPALIEIINFQRLTKQELKGYLKDSFGELYIDPSDLDYITESSFGNITYLNVIINYLRSKGILKEQNKVYKCGKIRAGSLTNVMKEHILQRYSLLDSDLKSVLSKSTIIGNKFTVDLLSKPFGIINADEVLSQIEEISRLIKREESDVFVFETTDSFLLINKMIPQQDHSEWHWVLANYYIRLLKNLQSRRKELSVLQQISHLYQVFFHFKHASRSQDSIQYGYKLIEKYMDICDFHNANKTIQEIRLLADVTDIEILDTINLYFHLDWLEALCLVSTGQYFDARPIYEACLNDLPSRLKPEQKFKLMLDASYCYFMCGDSDRSLEMCITVRSSLEQDRISELLYCRALSFLSSIYDYIGDQEEAKRNYINALNLCKEKGYEDEYYNILKKASMAYEEVFAVKMYPACIEYFRLNQKTNSLAETLHNLATDELYLDHKGRILEPLQESIQLLKSYGSMMLHYPLNTYGIYEAVFNTDYEKALDIFTSLLDYQYECYSEVVVRTNIFSCYLLRKNYDFAEKELREIDRLANQPVNQNVSEYKVFRQLNWSFYYYHLELYDEALKTLNALSKILDAEPRFKYLGQMLRYQIRTRRNLSTRKPVCLPPKPILSRYDDMGVYFLTLRFYE